MLESGAEEIVLKLELFILNVSGTKYLMTHIQLSDRKLFHIYVLKFLLRLQNTMHNGKK